jgi:hypothetical protein
MADGIPAKSKLLAPASCWVAGGVGSGLELGSELVAGLGLGPELGTELVAGLGLGLELGTELVAGLGLGLGLGLGAGELEVGLGLGLGLVPGLELVVGPEGSTTSCHTEGIVAHNHRIAGTLPPPSPA